MCDYIVMNNNAAANNRIPRNAEGQPIPMVLNFVLGIIDDNGGDMEKAAKRLGNLVRCNIKVARAFVKDAVACA